MANSLHSHCLIIEALTEEEKEKLAKIKKKMKRKVCNPDLFECRSVLLFISHPDFVCAYFLGTNEEKGGCKD